MATRDDDAGSSLRRWGSGSGDPQLQAAVELVIRYGLANPAYPWVKRGIPRSRWPEDWIDFRTLSSAAEQTPGQDGAVMRVAADFGRGFPVDPTVVAELDDDRRSLVLAAIVQRPMGEWPPPRAAAPRIPAEVIAQIIAKESRGLDRLLRDIQLNDDGLGTNI